MANDKEGRKIALLSLSSKDECYSPIVERIHELDIGSKLKFEYRLLTNHDLNGDILVSRKEFCGVILMHSAKEGRLSCTDVEDAAYNTLLPSLSDEFGSQHVGVIGFSIPGFNENTKKLKLDGFKEQQPSTSLCSKNIILCQSLSEISGDEWRSLLASFEGNSLEDVCISRNLLIIGIKPMIPLLIREAINLILNDHCLKLTFRTLSACENASCTSFQGAAILCHSEDDVKIFRAAMGHAKNNVMYKEALTKAAETKAALLPSSAEFSEECEALFKHSMFNPLKMLKYNYNEESNEVTFEVGSDVRAWLDKCLKSSSKRQTSSTSKDKGHLSILWSSLGGAYNFMTGVFRRNKIFTIICSCLCLLLYAWSCSGGLISRLTRHCFIIVQSYVILPVYSGVIYPAWSRSTGIIEWFLGYPQ